MPKEVDPYSKAYFSLLREHSEFKKSHKFGGAVLFELDGRVYMLERGGVTPKCHLNE